VKFLIDMNLSPEWAEVLGSSGISSKHWRQIGKANAIDEEIFNFARAENSIILTQDLDFSQVLFETAANGPSTVLLRLRDDLNIENRKRIVEIILQCQAELEAGALLVIDDHKARLRVLPLS
jgi:predicted nuclease of predicted toxin-antitoxin system